MIPVITTYLEMTDASQLRPIKSADTRFRILEATVKQWQYNRFFYELVGDKWGWRDRRSWNKDQWITYAEADNCKTICAYYDGSPAGYCELVLRGHDVEIVCFGLAQPFIGKGLGGPFLTHSLEVAWNMSANRVWLHTCTFDHAAALTNYKARGMVVYKVETKEIEEPV